VQGMPDNDEKEEGKGHAGSRTAAQYRGRWVMPLEGRREQGESSNPGGVKQYQRGNIIYTQR